MSPFDPRQTLTAWAEDHFHYAPDPQAPFHAPPEKISRVLNISAGDFLFPHHLFYVIEWPPAHSRIPVAIATDGKVEPLADDAALLHFLSVEVPASKTQAGRELLADAAVFLAIARTTDFTTREIPHTENRGDTVAATLERNPLRLAATLTFSKTGTLQSVRTAPGAQPETPHN